MRHSITEHDKELILQSSINYKYKLIVKKGNTYLDELVGIANFGSYNVDSESDIRRKISFTLLLDDLYYNEHIEQKIIEWIGYDFELHIGIENGYDGRFTWYRCGTYAISQTNTTYDATTNSISADLSDWFIKINGERNGQIGGAPIIEIQNTDSNGKKVTIQQAAIGVLEMAGLTDYIVQDIGEFYGMEQYNPDYMQYRSNQPDWNQLPYDLTYNCGIYISNMLIDLRDMYPNCEMYFDIYNNFCFNMIPSCNADPIVLDNAFIQDVIVSANSESVSYNTNSIKNVTEIFGKVYDVDRFSESCSYSSNIYTVSLEEYSSYKIGEIIAFTPNAANAASTKIRINSLSPIPVYHEFTTTFVPANTIMPDEVQCIKIGYINNGYAAYYLGQYQPHAICVMTSNLKDPVYTMDYFKAKYNCKNVTLRLDTDSEFSVQKKGLLFETLSGDNFDNILSNSVAISNSIYYNQRSSIMNDTVTICTKMIPWLDVNVKVSYKKQQESEEHQYIIKSVSHSLEDMTSTITMYKFSPLYF